PLEAPPPVTVVDRPGWVEANAGGFEALLEPLVQRLAERRPPAPLVQAVGSRVTGAEVGVLLAYLAGRVLGQYELFLPPGQRQSEAETPASEAAERSVSTGRLTLVAPNIVATERALGVDPHDFRLWVCLHEVTHRTQFTAIPWLRDHLLAEITAFVD